MVGKREAPALGMLVPVETRCEPAAYIRAYAGCLRWHNKIKGVAVGTGQAPRRGMVTRRQLPARAWGADADASPLAMNMRSAGISRK